MFDAYARRAEGRRFPVVPAVLVVVAAIGAVVYAMRTTETPTRPVEHELYAVPPGTPAPNLEARRIQLPGMSLVLNTDPVIAGTERNGKATFSYTYDLPTWFVQWTGEADPPPAKLDAGMRKWLATAVDSDMFMPRIVGGMRITGERAVAIGELRRNALVFEFGDPRGPTHGTFATVPCGGRLVYLIVFDEQDARIDEVLRSFRCDVSGG